jgi:hypothetical protein
MALLESRVEGLWIVKQPGKGVDVVSTDAGIHRMRKVGGDANLNRDDFSENYSDGSRFPDFADGVNTLVGDGNPVGQATADICGYSAYLLAGQETVTGSADPYTHVATPAAAAFWAKVWKKVGDTVGPLRQEFADCRLTSVRIEGSTANKVVKLTLSFTSLLAGKTFTTDPVAVSSADTPFAYTDGEGRFTIDGTVYRGHTQFAIVISDNIQVAYGDSVLPQDIGFQAAGVALEGITLLLDSNALSRYYQQLYGNPSPPAGTAPLKVLPPKGSYSADLRRGEMYALTITGTPTGGTFTPSVDGQATTPVAYNAIASVLQTALEALPNVDPGDVIVTGGPGPGTPYTIAFTRFTPATFTVANALTGGTTPNAAITDNGARRQLLLEVPGVKWSPDLAIAGNPDGGLTELPLAGEARKVSGQPFYRITTKSAEPAYT